MPNPYPRKTLAAIAAALAAGGIGTYLITSVVTGSITIGTGGTSIDKHVRATVTVNPSSIGAGQSTTTVVTLTGAVAGDHCSVNVTSGDLGGTTSTAVLRCVAGTDSATVTYYNATGTAAYDAGSSVLSVQGWSY